MRRLKGRVAIVAILGGAAAVVTLAPRLGLLCATSEVNRVVAPDGEWDAIVVLENCGATTRERSAVAIRRHGSRTPRLRLGLAARSDTPFTPEVRWSGDTLVVVYGAGARLLTADNRVASVTVRFETR